MHRIRISHVLRWLESFLNVSSIPIVFVALLGTTLFGWPPSLIDGLTLGVLVLLVVSIGLQRFGLLHDMADQINKLTQLSNVRLLGSANEYGVVNLFVRANGEYVRDVVGEIERTRGPLDLCGVALPELVCDDNLRGTILAHSEKADVRVLLLDPCCEEAKRRAEIEQPLGRRAIADIEGTIAWLRQQQAQNKRFRVHLYTLPPSLWMIITSQFVFVEPYHFGRSEALQGCIGGHVPMLKIRNQSDLGPHNPHEFYRRHFEYIWAQTHGLRLNILITILHAVKSAYVILKNEMPFDIAMDGWKLSGQGSHQPFCFEQGFVWNKRAIIAVGSARPPDIKVDQHFPNSGAFMGNNSILTLTNAAGTVVREWAVSSYLA